MCVRAANTKQPLARDPKVKRKGRRKSSMSSTATATRAPDLEVVAPDVGGELRGKIAQHNLRLYELAAEVGCHPGRLGQMLRGAVSLPAELAERLRRAIEARIA
jgi:hypothetical protein